LAIQAKLVDRKLKLKLKCSKLVIVFGNNARGHINGLY